MSTPVANAIARMNAKAAMTADAPGRSFQESEIALLRGKLDAAYAENDAILRTSRETRAELTAEITRLQAELGACEMRCSDAERRCAEMQGRIAGMESAPKPEAEDDEYEMKYESLVSEHADLRVAHGACAAREEGLRQLIAELRRSNETLTAQVQAALAEEPEDESEDESEAEGGCEIEVLRGGDDRVRSLRVRYTK